MCVETLTVPFLRSLLAADLLVAVSFVQAVSHLAEVLFAQGMHLLAEVQFVPEVFLRAQVQFVPEAFLRAGVQFVQVSLLMIVRQTLLASILVPWLFLRARLELTQYQLCSLWECQFLYVRTVSVLSLPKTHFKSAMVVPRVHLRSLQYVHQNHVQQKCRVLKMMRYVTTRSVRMLLEEVPM